jgi:hypothetical protein
MQFSPGIPLGPYISLGTQFAITPACVIVHTHKTTGSVTQQNCKACRSGVALFLILLNMKYFGKFLHIEVLLQVFFSSKDILIDRQFDRYTELIQNDISLLA